MAVQVRESKHPYDNNTNFEVSRLLLLQTCALLNIWTPQRPALCWDSCRVFCPQDKVHIPGAIYLSVKFDSRCYTEEGCDELIMSSSSDFVQDVHNFSGSPQKWSDFEIPGEDRPCVFAFEIV